MATDIQIEERAEQELMDHRYNCEIDPQVSQRMKIYEEDGRLGGEQLLGHGASGGLLES